MSNVAVRATRTFKVGGKTFFTAEAKLTVVTDLERVSIARCWGTSQKEASEKARQLVLSVPPTPKEPEHEKC